MAGDKHLASHVIGSLSYPYKILYITFNLGYNHTDDKSYCLLEYLTVYDERL